MQSPVLYNRTLLSTLSTCNSLHLLRVAVNLIFGMAALVQLATIVPFHGHSGQHISNKS